MNNIMIDLETMGSGSKAAIVAIGAVKFDKNGIGDTLYRKIDLVNAAEYGEIDPETVLWWLKQSDEARKELTEGETVLPFEALAVLDYFIKECGEKVYIWGCGSDFDNVILANLFEQFKSPMPWKYWNNRCYRTIKSVFRDVKMERKGTHHNALDDAVSQAEHLIEIAKQKGIEL